MGNDDFEKRTISFLAWLNQIGVKMSPKMALVDLRTVGRGRGVSEYFTSLYLSLSSENDLLGLLANYPVVAIKDFEEDELVFSIPRSAVLNIRTTVPSISSMTLEVLEDTPSWLVRSSDHLNDILPSI
jgi:SET domain-containing protein 6